MKRIIRFSKFYVPAVIISLSLIFFGLVGFVTKGFNLGVDFQAGINQTVQLAYPAISVTYGGKGNVTITMAEDKATVIFTGAEVENRTVVVEYAKSATIGEVAAALSAITDVVATVTEKPESASTLLVPTFQGDTRLGPEAFLMHRAPVDEAESFASIDKVREALSATKGISVQQIRPESLQRFLIRVQDEGTQKDFSAAAPAMIKSSLETAFGADRVVVMNTDYVGARYSQSLRGASIGLVLGAVALIIAYAAIRFGFQYGLGAVIAIMHDALIMVAFVVWSRMEFNTSTIAAILTILGYSINDTIVQFDRVREERKLNPSAPFVNVLDSALTITLGRTIITTMTTMLTVLALFFFTSGSIKDFALALFIGMISGTYSTIYIASAFVLWWENLKNKRIAEGRTAKSANPVIKKADAS